MITVMACKETTVLATLTPTDKIILETYKQLVEGLSDYLGEGYELVLHSLDNLDHSAIKVINGYHTGRTEGAPITDLALNMLNEIKEQKTAGYISYFTKNKNGDSLKSSTIAIPGENGNIIGLLCINLYLNTPFIKMLQNFVSDATAQHKSESFMNNVDDLLAHTVSQIKDEVFANPAILASNKNKEIISRLYEGGIFNIKDAVAQTATLLGINKNTVYMHLRNLANNKQ